MSQSFGRPGRSGHAFSHLDMPSVSQARVDIAAEPSTDLEGQERRIAMFHAVEDGVSVEVERVCAKAALEVTDVGVLVMSSAGHTLVFGEPSDAAAVVLGHRDKLYEMLTTALPAVAGSPNPFEDLLHPAPPRCVRVLVLDGSALTVLSYGSFFTLDLGAMPDA